MRHCPNVGESDNDCDSQYEYEAEGSYNNGCVNKSSCNEEEFDDDDDPEHDYNDDDYEHDDYDDDYEDDYEDEDEYLYSRIRFSPMEDILPIPSIYDMSPKQIHAIWYQPEDYDAFFSECENTVVIMEDDFLYQLEGKFLDDSDNDDDDDDDDSVRQAKDTIYSFLGLDHWTVRGFEKRRRLRFDSVETVLGEQYAQWQDELKEEDVVSIAELYRARCQYAEMNAVTRGLRMEREVREHWIETMGEEYIEQRRKSYYAAKRILHGKTSCKITHYDNRIYNNNYVDDGDEHDVPLNDADQEDGNRMIPTSVRMEDDNDDIEENENGAWTSTVSVTYITPKQQPKPTAFRIKSLPPNVSLSSSFLTASTTSCTTTGSLVSPTSTSKLPLQPAGNSNHNLSNDEQDQLSSCLLEDQEEEEKEGNASTVTEPKKKKKKKKGKKKTTDETKLKKKKKKKTTIEGKTTLETNTEEKKTIKKVSKKKNETKSLDSSTSSTATTISTTSSKSKTATTTKKKKTTTKKKKKQQQKEQQETEEATAKVTKKNTKKKKTDGKVKKTKKVKKTTMAAQ